MLLKLLHNCSNGDFVVFKDGYAHCVGYTHSWRCKVDPDLDICIDAILLKGALSKIQDYKLIQKNAQLVIKGKSSIKINGIEGSNTWYEHKIDLMNIDHSKIVEILDNVKPYVKTKALGAILTNAIIDVSGGVMTGCGTDAFACIIQTFEQDGEARILIPRWSFSYVTSLMDETTKIGMQDGKLKIANDDFELVILTTSGRKDLRSQIKSLPSTGISHKFTLDASLLKHALGLVSLDIVGQVKIQGDGENVMLSTLTSRVEISEKVGTTNASFECLFSVEYLHSITKLCNEFEYRGAYTIGTSGPVTLFVQNPTST